MSNRKFDVQQDKLVSVILPEAILDRMVNTIIEKRKSGSTGVPIFVDPLVLKDIIRAELAKGE